MIDLNVIECIQGSPEWFQSRMGMLTASRIAAAIGKPKREKTGELKARFDIKLELAVERLTKKTAAHFVTEWMERGKEMEPLARCAYELRVGVETEQVGFVLHPNRDDFAWAGCSPDGLVGEHGLVEFKVPKSTTHAEYLLGDCVPAEYRDQMMWQMACTGRAWNDFVSYCPDFPEPLDVFICRLHRDESRILEMEAEARNFLLEVEQTVGRLEGGLEAALAQSVRNRKLQAGLPQHEPSGGPGNR